MSWSASPGDFRDRVGFRDPDFTRARRYALSSWQRAQLFAMTALPPMPSLPREGVIAVFQSWRRGMEYEACFVGPMPDGGTRLCVVSRSTSGRWEMSPPGTWQEPDYFRLVWPNEAPDVPMYTQRAEFFLALAMSAVAVALMPSAV